MSAAAHSFSHNFLNHQLYTEVQVRMCIYIHVQRLIYMYTATMAKICDLTIAKTKQKTKKKEEKKNGLLHHSVSFLSAKIQEIETQLSVMQIYV